MMVEGKSDRQIQNELDLSLQNWHKNYPPQPNKEMERILIEEGK